MLASVTGKRRGHGKMIGLVSAYFALNKPQVVTDEQYFVCQPEYLFNET